jgi:DNA-directed RNA polymerase alpha subunit
MEGKVNIAEGDPLDPAPELPDDTPIDRVQFPTRIHRALAAAGLKTIGEIRETSNEKLLDLQDLGSGSVSYLREAVGLPSCDGVRSLEKRLR